MRLNRPGTGRPLLPCASNDRPRHECRFRSDETGANPAVRDWLDEQSPETLYLLTVTIAELLFGVNALPAGRRRLKLATALDGILGLFDGRVLPFDFNAARRYADLAVKARKAGKGFPTPDGYIAATAVSHGFSVATRDTSAFDAAPSPSSIPGIRVADRSFRVAQTRILRDTYHQ
jgi:predicted nucleic acid-binding protein